MSKWTTECPTENGLYWFYGELYRPPGNRPEPRLNLVEVRKIRSGIGYLVSNNYINEDGGMQGLWQKAELPELPKIQWKYKWDEFFYWCDNPTCLEYRNWKSEWKFKKDGGQCAWCDKELTLVEDDLSEFPNESQN